MVRPPSHLGIKANQKDMGKRRVKWTLDGGGGDYSGAKGERFTLGKEGRRL